MKNHPPQILLIPLTDIKAYPNNPKDHGKAQINELAAGMKTYGFMGCILVDTNNVVIAGHGRVEAAKLAGLTEIPAMKVTHLTPAQIAMYRIADNKLAEKSKWNKSLLAIEFDHLMAFNEPLDLSLTGFAIPEIDLMIHDKDAQDPDEGDESPEPAVQAITRTGDIWALGQHRIICGNSLEEDVFQRLMEGQKAQAVFTDPPYNVKIEGHVSGLGKVKHDEFAMASGEMTESQFTAFLTSSCRLMAAHSVDGALAFVCMDWRHMRELLAAGDAVKAELKNLCVWSKDNGGMGALYRSQHELVFVFKFGTAAHINNVELGKHGRYRTNVWNYRGANSLRKGRNEDLAMHPTVKPLRMVSDALLDVSHRDGLVLDPFGGSGTTLIAAEKTGRRARLIEMDPKYVDVTIRRWQELTGQEAIHAETGQTFNQCATEVIHG